MKVFSFLSTYLLVFVLIFTSQKSWPEEEKKGWLREKIKARILKKLEDRPAPKTTTEVHSKIESPGNYTFSINHQDLERFYILHVPPEYNSKTPTPLVFSLHGGGGDMTIQSSDEFYKLISKSDKEGFIAIFPNGFSQFKSGKLATWNAGNCCGGARDGKIDDVGFIKEILQFTSKQLNIDQNKIFATGMSNGGMMSYRLACELPNIFKAIASVAGTDNTINCKPSVPISILHIHAKNDDHVLFNGGAGKPFAKDKSKVTDFISVPETISKWVKLNNCESTPKRVFENKLAYCDKYSKCRNKVEVQLCVTETGAHSWPGGKKPRGGGGEAPSMAISANDIMWDFFNNKESK